MNPTGLLNGPARVPSKTKGHPRRWLILVLSVFLVAAGLAMWFLPAWKRGAFLSSPANQVRPWAEPRWDEFTADRSGLPALPGFSAADFFDAHSISVADTEVDVFFDHQWRPPRRPSLEHFDLRKGSDRSISPPVRLKAIGIKTFTESFSSKGPDRDFWEGYRGPPSFFWPDGRAVPENEFPELETLQWWGGTYGWPNLFFWLDHSEFPHLRVDEARVFDSRTHVCLSGLSFSDKSLPVPGRDQTVVACPHQSWRRNGALLALDVSFGEPIEATLTPKTGEEVSLGIHTIRMLAAIPDFPVENARGADSDRIHITYLRETEGNPFDPVGSAFVIASYPCGIWTRLDFECVDMSGNSVESEVWDMHESASPLLLACESRFEEIAGIRVRVRPRCARILMPLPDLPTLPAENDHLTDLMDMQIPYMRTEGLQRWRDLARRMTQMSPEFHDHGNFQEWPPREYHNITPREIVADIRNHYPEMAPVVIDSRNFVFRTGRPMGSSWRDRFRSWWKKVFP